MKTVDLIYFDAGGGHRAAATALEHAIRAAALPVEPRMVHLRDILDPIDVFRKVTRIDLQEIYNLMLRKGWTLGAGLGLRFMQRVIALYHRPARRLLAAHWRRQPADLAVSLVPNFNRALYEGFREACPHGEFVTILTDLADYPPHFWIERGQRQHFVCGTPRAREQALELGHPAERVFLASGMILNPRFYDLPPLDPAAERGKLGLDPSRPTALVLFGGYGSPAMLDIQRRLAEARLDVQVIFIAGRNQRLQASLEARAGGLVQHVTGFTADVPYYMRLADFFIGKPGPGSLSEALHLGLPAITIRNAWTLPQERFNADWLVQSGAGLVLSSFKHIVPAVRTMLAPGNLAAMREAARAHQNRALFEIPPLLARLAGVSVESPSA